MLSRPAIQLQGSRTGQAIDIPRHIILLIRKHIRSRNGVMQRNPHLTYAIYANYSHAASYGTLRLASPCLPCRHRQAMGEGFSVPEGEVSLPRQEELHIAALHPAVLDVNAHGIGQANTCTLFQRHVLHPEMTVIII